MRLGLKYQYTLAWSGILLLVVAAAAAAAAAGWFCEEAFTPKDKTKRTKSPRLILLGDSILNNSMYVAPDESVEYLLRHSNTNRTANDSDSIVFLAEDNACIEDVLHSQLLRLPATTTGATHLFLSAGGNDILNAIQLQTLSLEGITHLFEEYKQLVIALQTQCPQAHLHLFNLYYPTQALLQPYYKYIDHWNLQLQEFILASNTVLQDVPLSKLCLEDLDFVHAVEPSAVCSQKIVKHILSATA
jgi:hypothetical protein